MRRVVLTYGLFAGVTVWLLMVITVTLVPPESDFVLSYLLGFVSMVLGLSLIYLAIRSYRDRYLDSTITLRKGFLVGVYVSLVASILYVIGWKLFTTVVMPGFWDQQATHVIDGLAKSGASAAEISQKTKELQAYKADAHRHIDWALAFLEIFPLGLIISAICAHVLRKVRAS